jgi:hypothetical protein
MWNWRADSVGTGEREKTFSEKEHVVADECNLRQQQMQVARADDDSYEL